MPGGPLFYNVLRGDPALPVSNSTGNSSFAERADGPALAGGPESLLGGAPPGGSEAWGDEILGEKVAPACVNHSKSHSLLDYQTLSQRARVSVMSEMSFSPRNSGEGPGAARIAKPTTGPGNPRSIESPLARVTGCEVVLPGGTRPLDSLPPMPKRIPRANGTRAPGPVRGGSSRSGSVGWVP